MVRLALWLIALVATGAPAAAQRWPSEECIDNPNIPSCLQSGAADLARAYGVRRIEEHRDAGDEVLRIFFIKDGNRAVISVVRAAGRAPTAYIHFPRVAGQPAPAPMEAPMPQQSWDMARYRAEYADRSFAPVPPRPSDPQIVCLHPWTYLFEASAPAEPIYGQPARIRRHSVSSCDDAPLLHFAGDLQRLVMPLFPACDILDPILYGNGVQRFAMCRRLSGDRLAAAHVLNRAHPFQLLGGSADPHDLDDLFASDATIDWNGRGRPADQRNPAIFWRERIAGDSVNAFHIEAVEGLGQDRVRLTGYLLRDQPGTDDGTLRARFGQIWIRGPSGLWVASATVGRWVPTRD